LASGGQGRLKPAARAVWSKKITVDFPAKAGKAGCFFDLRG
jgi:hypothetical protein